MKEINGLSLSHQRGAVLAVTLILLLVMTVLAAANIQSSSLELKMAAASNTRQQTFQTAESALRWAEDQIQLAGFIEDNHNDLCIASTSCYDLNCTGGTCFSGTYLSTDTRFDCNPSPTVSREPVWRDATLNVWNDANKHRTINVTGSSVNPKYIVEFLCFVQNKDKDTFDATDSGTANSGSPLYRITVLAESEDAKSNVMLQSTFRIDKVAITPGSP